MIDIFSNEGSTLPVSVPTAAAILAGVFVIGAAANTGRSILMRISGQRIVANVRAAAYRNVLRQDAAWYDLQGQNASDSLATGGAAVAKATSGAAAPNPAHGAPEIKVKGTGDIISRLGSDASIVGDSVTRELGEGLRALLTTAIGLGLMCYISLRLTAVMCLIVPPSAVAAVLYGRYIRKLSKKTQKVRR